MTRRLAAGVILAALATGCAEQVPPSTEDQMRSMGLPLDVLIRIDVETQVTVRSTDGVPELLIFVPDSLGGSYLGINPAKRPTINGGMVGEASSLGPFDASARAYRSGRRYLFGAGQGPLARVETDEPEARTELINPDVNGWLIVVPETVGTFALPWRLVGADGTVIYASAGIGMPDVGLAVDDDTQAFVRFRDGIPELLVYTTNAFGGADLAVTAADTPTVNGGLAGTATSPGYRYLFGAGQGRLKPNGVNAGVIRTADQTPVSARSESTETVVDQEPLTYDASWIVVVPDSVPLDDVQWQLTDRGRTVIYEAVGLTPTGPGASP